jgi:predicted nucleic acid-binding protein
MNIIIDTNAVNANLLLSNAGIKKLAIKASKTGYKICFPEVVLSEMIKHFNSNMEQKLRTLKKNARDVFNLLGIDIIAS